MVLKLGFTSLMSADPTLVREQLDAFVERVKKEKEPWLMCTSVMTSLMTSFLVEFLVITYIYDLFLWNVACLQFCFVLLKRKLIGYIDT